MSIRSAKLSLASPESILSWTERSLPNGKKVGEVLKSDLINYKNGLPVRDGLSCQRIFGPIVSFTCSCGRFKCIESNNNGINVIRDTWRKNLGLAGDNQIISKLNAIRKEANPKKEMIWVKTYLASNFLFSFSFLFRQIFDSSLTRLFLNVFPTSFFTENFYDYRSRWMHEPLSENEITIILKLLNWERKYYKDHFPFFFEENSYFPLIFAEDGKFVPEKKNNEELLWFESSSGFIQEKIESQVPDNGQSFVDFTNPSQFPIPDWKKLQTVGSTKFIQSPGRFFKDSLLINWTNKELFNQLKINSFSEMESQKKYPFFLTFSGLNFDFKSFSTDHPISKFLFFKPMIEKRNEQLIVSNFPTFFTQAIKLKTKKGLEFFANFPVLWNKKFYLLSLYSLLCLKKIFNHKFSFKLAFENQNPIENKKEIYEMHTFRLNINFFYNYAFLFFRWKSKKSQNFFMSFFYNQSFESGESNNIRKLRQSGSIENSQFRKALSIKNKKKQIFLKSIKYFLFKTTQQFFYLAPFFYKKKIKKFQPTFSGKTLKNSYYPFKDPYFISFFLSPISHIKKKGENNFLALCQLKPSQVLPRNVFQTEQMKNGMILKKKKNSIRTINDLFEFYRLTSLMSEDFIFSTSNSKLNKWFSFQQFCNLTFSTTYSNLRLQKLSQWNKKSTEKIIKNFFQSHFASKILQKKNAVFPKQYDTLCNRKKLSRVSIYDQKTIFSPLLLFFISFHSIALLPNSLALSSLPSQILHKNLDHQGGTHFFREKNRKEPSLGKRKKFKKIEFCNSQPIDVGLKLFFFNTTGNLSDFFKFRFKNKKEVVGKSRFRHRPLRNQQQYEIFAKTDAETSTNLEPSFPTSGISYRDFSSLNFASEKVVSNSEANWTQQEREKLTKEVFSIETLEKKNQWDGMNNSQSYGLRYLFTKEFNTTNPKKKLIFSTETSLKISSLVTLDFINEFIQFNSAFEISKSHIESTALANPEVYFPGELYKIGKQILHNKNKKIQIAFKEKPRRLKNSMIYKKNFPICVASIFIHLVSNFPRFTVSPTKYNHPVFHPFRLKNGTGKDFRNTNISNVLESIQMSYSSSEELYLFYKLSDSIKGENPSNKISFGRDECYGIKMDADQFIQSPLLSYTFSDRLPKEMKYCSNCEVELMPSYIRRYRMGYIEFLSPIAHVWYTSRSIPFLLDFPGKLIEGIAECHQQLSSGFPPILTFRFVRFKSDRKRFKLLCTFQTQFLLDFPIRCSSSNFFLANQKNYALTYYFQNNYSPNNSLENNRLKQLTSSPQFSLFATGYFEKEIKNLALASNLENFISKNMFRIPTLFIKKNQGFLQNLESFLDLVPTFGAEGDLFNFPVISNSQANWTRREQFNKKKYDRSKDNYLHDRNTNMKWLEKYRNKLKLIISMTTQFHDKNIPQNLYFPINHNLLYYFYYFKLEQILNSITPFLKIFFYRNQFEIFRCSLPNLLNNFDKIKKKKKLSGRLQFASELNTTKAKKKKNLAIENTTYTLIRQLSDSILHKPTFSGFFDYFVREYYPKQSILYDKNHLSIFYRFMISPYPTNFLKDIELKTLVKDIDDSDLDRSFRRRLYTIRSETSEPFLSSSYFLDREEIFSQTNQLPQVWTVEKEEENFQKQTINCQSKKKYKPSPGGPIYEGYWTRRGPEISFLAVSRIFSNFFHQQRYIPLPRFKSESEKKIFFSISPIEIFGFFKSFVKRNLFNNDLIKSVARNLFPPLRMQSTHYVRKTKTFFFTHQSHAGCMNKIFFIKKQKKFFLSQIFFCRF